MKLDNFFYEFMLSGDKWEASDINFYFSFKVIC